MVPGVSSLDQTFAIRDVTLLTGLSAPRIRQWERRHHLVRPLRLSNGYRAYTAEQVAILRAVARLIEAGHEIGDLVRRPKAELIIEAGTEPGVSGAGGDSV
jgi:DNA-binding transcriptional MerR regulator